MTTQTKFTKYVFCDTSTVTIPRIAQLMQMSIKEETFRDLLFDKIEIFDEFSILSQRIRAVSSTSYKTSIDRNTKYTLTYMDGQLVEVNDLVAERTIFRNMEDFIFAFCSEDYTAVSKYDPEITEIPYIMEETGEFIKLPPEVVEYIQERPNELFTGDLSDDGILTVPDKYLYLLDSPEEYAEICSRSKIPAVSRWKAGEY